MYHPLFAHKTIVDLVKQQGYRTGLVVNQDLKERFTGLHQGFDLVTSSYLDDNWKKWRQGDAPSVTVKAIEFIEQEYLQLRVRRPFFLMLYYQDPHSPYSKHQGGYPTFKGVGRNYQGEIAFADRHVGSLLQYLAHRADLREDTIVVVTADHGEEFGEHGKYRHSRTCYRESVHVPLIVHIPGMVKRRVSQPVALIDISLTLAELLGVDRAGAGFQGQSLLVPALAPRLAPADRPIFCDSATVVEPFEFWRGVRSGQHFLTRDMVHDEVELYDSEADPREKQPLLGPEHESRRADLRMLLDAEHIGNLNDMSKFRPQPIP